DSLLIWWRRTVHRALRASRLRADKSAGTSSRWTATKDRRQLLGVPGSSSRFGWLEREGRQAVLLRRPLQPEVHPGKQRRLERLRLRASREKAPDVAPPRSPGRVGISRFARDRLSLVAAIVFALILVVSIAGGPIAQALLRHNGEQPFPYAVDWNQKPVGPMSRVYATPNPAVDRYNDLIAPPKSERAKTLLVFGGDGPLGRDELIRVLDGGRASLEIAVGGMLIALLIGVPLGCVAGYFRGISDAIVSRVTETIMAFPLMLFLVWASVRLDQYLTPISLSPAMPRGIVADALLIGIFTSFYPARLIRAQLLPLRSAEFVEASRMVGSSDWRILRRQLLPHLLPTLLVWGAIAIATNILLEVGLSFLGAGVQPQTPSWG